MELSTMIEFEGLKQLCEVKGLKFQQKIERA